MRSPGHAGIRLPHLFRRGEAGRYLDIEGGIATVAFARDGSKGRSTIVWDPRRGVIGRGSGSVGASASFIRTAMGIVPLRAAVWSIAGSLAKA